MNEQAESELNINTLQELHLEIIAQTNFNNCDGIKIAKLLRENRALWRAVIIHGNEFLLLRELEKGDSMADTLYILAKDGYESQLEKLAKEQFEADEVQWVQDEIAQVLLRNETNRLKQSHPTVLSIWWD
ncbi:MAG: hypothetical protein WBW94_07800 [Anaerolineales bacterium]